MAHPRMTSSIIAGSRPGVRSIAALITAPAMSSGLVSLSVPRGALPTAVLSDVTITASFISILQTAIGPINPLLPTHDVPTAIFQHKLIPQRLPSLQHVLYSLLRFFLAAQGNKFVAFQIQ